MTGIPDTPRGKFPFLPWLVVLAAVLGYVVWDSFVVGSHLLRVTASYGVTVNPPATDPRSPTGYEDGQRSLVLPASAADTAHWVMQTQDMFARGEWRLRHVDYDNAPAGREVHWSSPVHWWLALTAWVDHLVSGRPIGISVERAILIAGPVSFVILLLGLVPLLARYFSPTAAMLAVVGAATTYPFYIDFVPGHAGHHAAVNFCCMATVLFMLAGSLRAAREPAARRTIRAWFIASGVTAATGLWISAATQTPVLIGVGLGLVAGTWLARTARPPLAWIQDPALLRLWGLAGGGMSLAAYAIEYFPSHLGFRLEVNHPLYALAFAGAGEALALGTRAMTDGIHTLTRREIMRGLAAAAAVAALPATLAMTSPGTFVVADPFVWHLHTDYISEFQGLVRYFISTKFSWNVVGLCVPMLLLVPPLVLVFRRATPPGARGLIAFALMPALVTLILGWTQVRWVGLAYALSVPAVAFFFQTLESPGAARRTTVILWTAACGLLLVPGAVSAVQRTRAGADFTNEEIRLLAQRDVAHWLRQRAGREPVVVAGAPDSTSNLVYQGGLSGLGTLYWENAEGLKNAAALFAAPTAEAAHAMARRLGVTHVVFFSWDAFEFAMVKLARGRPPESPLPTDSFMARLLAEPVPPPWLQAIPFTLPEHSALAGQQIRIWEVTPDQTAPEAAAHAANYYLETGKPEVAERLAPVLAGFGDDLAANVMLAGVASSRGNPDAFAAALGRVNALLSQAGSLSLGDRVHLVVVLTIGQQLDRARDQLQACLKQADEATLRKLTPGTLSDLLALAEAFHLDLPDPALHRLAESLVPPFRRK
jgi:hypothetical protein